ncbi:MAG: Gfo/Idh/MocA family oxidoreductase [Acidobacteriaceae bacterium]|nr:Gfo/Idh/MocA family oxidoreductase [Acidobacteriaceae bacterium]
MAVIGAGAFGASHIRVLSGMADVELVAVVDLDLAKAKKLANGHGSSAFASLDQLPAEIDAAIVATPTVTHETVAETLLGSGIDVLIEKPIADSAEAGERLTRLATENGRILQVGHLERFNPAVVELGRLVTVPLFFEVHRLSVFTPRSLDVDVVLDLMIHDLDIVLRLTSERPKEIRAAGISVLSPKVDIANVRLSFASGCVANLTASRISTEQVRKLRLFQPGEYLSVDYKRQDLTKVRVLRNELVLPNELSLKSSPGSKTLADPVLPNERENGFVFSKVPVANAEPLALELAAFVEAVRKRSNPKVGGAEATEALRLAEEILATIKVHAQTVSETIRRRGKH